MEMNTSKLAKDAKDTYQGVTRAGDHLVEKAKAGAEQVLDKANSMDLASRYEAIKDSASEGYDTAISTVKKYPLYALGGAAVIGLLTGAWLARRRN